jgi:hypothetical protein
MAIGSAIGYAVGRFAAPAPIMGVFVACVALGNYGNLPLGVLFLK